MIWFSEERKPDDNNINWLIQRMKRDEGVMKAAFKFSSHSFAALNQNETVLYIHIVRVRGFKAPRVSDKDIRDSFICKSLQQRLV